MFRQTTLTLAGLLSIALTSHAATFTAPTLFATGSAVNATGPDSITTGFGSVWVAYTNGLSGTGLIPGTSTVGNSTVVQYSLAGAIQNTYSLAGSIDGLKIDPNSGTVWALMNQDGNSAVDLINPATKAVTSLTYATSSPSSGYDDIVFIGNSIYLSYTNPNSNADNVVVSLNNRNSPLNVSTVLTYGASPANLNDPDSLKQDANGSLYLSSGDDGTVNIVTNPGISPALTTITLSVGGVALNASGKGVGLDDTLVPMSAQGNIYLTNTSLNQVLVLSGTGFSNSDLYANVGSSQNAFGQVNRATGDFTPIVSSLSAPHGLAFVSTPEPGTLAMGGAGLLLICIAKLKKPRKG